MNSTEASIALNMVPGVGPVRLRRLLETFETPEQVLLARAAQLRAVNGVGQEVAEAIAGWQDKVDLSAELKRISDFGAKVIIQESPEYPRMLREISNPPIVLYVWGELIERDQHALGVVGSRQTSHYGLECAKKLSYQLAYAGLTVVSGLARGIDTAAHQGALAAQGRTVAVIGSGLMDLYPPENQGLAEKIAASGAVVSEFPMTLPPSTQTFPYRNRIVAGWGSGVLVVEAGQKSGALITATQALEQGRLVYAVPGQIDRPTSAGSNRLIQQGAKLVTGAADILDDLSILFHEPSKKGPPATAPTLSSEEQTILGTIDSAETPLDLIVTKSGLPMPKVASTLLALEMKRLVKQLPGQQFVKI
ncbi:MAG: DNA-processing protein DprA [Chthoniobacter sp.]|uniref:DNA-processing protein DprA n=1 Tax=Chthoniobacter sp. TaxID=2510640 RepID=UPI0032A6038A